VYREFRFTLEMPATLFTEDEGLRQKFIRDDVSILAQGVFDCIYFDGEGDPVVVDYKTDRLTAYEMSNPELARERLRERHSRQLGYYAYACEKIFGKKPAGTYIYSLPLHETIPVTVSL